jgi:hypothetical protein
VNICDSTVFNPVSEARTWSVKEAWSMMEGVKKRYSNGKFPSREASSQSIKLDVSDLRRRSRRR